QRAHPYQAGNQRQPGQYTRCPTRSGTRHDARARAERRLCRRGVRVPGQAPAGIQGEMMQMASKAVETENTTFTENPQELAEQTGRVMYERDPASQALGARLESIAPGEAVMSMTVRADMLNGHQTCHGGFIFALADSTFAFACNSR